MKRIAFAARVVIEVLLLVSAIVMIRALSGLLDDTSRPVRGNDLSLYDTYRRLRGRLTAP